MRTDDLVSMLASGDVATAPDFAARRYAAGIFSGASGAVLLLTVFLGVRSDLAQAVLLPMFWVKLAFVAWIAVVSFLMVVKLARPGLRPARATGALAVPVIAMWILAAAALIRSDRSQWGALFYGETWASCPLLIAMLSVPAFVAMIWALNGFAPTRLRLAGAVAGLLSGAIGALVYSLHCRELEAPFIGSWYLLGMAMPVATGALAGPRLLRW